MVDRARQLLKNLMGDNINNIRHEDGKHVCIYEIAGGCPYEMLKNTKISIGNCKYTDHKIVRNGTININIVAYENELLSIIKRILDDIQVKINNEKPITDDDICEKEIELDIKLKNIDNDITEENINEKYAEFLDLEEEIYKLERTKEGIYNNNKGKYMTVCHICGMEVIKNFCSKKYLAHVKGRAHSGMCKLRNIYNRLVNKME